MNKRPRRSCDSQGRASMEQQLLEDLIKTFDVTSIPDVVKSMVEGQESESEKDEFLRRSFALGRRLQKVSIRLIREQATCHNSHVWPFTYDLSLKIFSSLGARNICRAAATCTLFYKLSLDSSCYDVVDLSTVGLAVTDAVVAKMVYRAGSHLRILKLGIVAQPFTQLTADAANFTPYSLLSVHCLRPLSMVAGTTLQSLQLYNIGKVDTKVLSKALAACPALLELKLVGLNLNLNTTMTYIAAYCSKLETLWCASGSVFRQRIKNHACRALVASCSRITSLTLRGCNLADVKAEAFMRGLQHLKYVDFSEASALHGACLRPVPVTLESLILKDCMQLKKAEIEKFLYALIDGENKALRHLDISNMEGLESNRWRAKPSLELIARVRSLRPHLCLLADNPFRKSGTSGGGSDSDSDSMSLDYSDDSVGMLSQDHHLEDYTSGTSIESDLDEYEDEDEDEDDFVVDLDEFLESSGDSE